MIAALAGTVACARVSPEAEVPVEDAATDAAVEDTATWGLDAFLEDTAGPETRPPRPFAAACGAATYEACAASAHDVIVDVTSSAPSRIVKVQGVTVLADPPQLLHFSRVGPPTPIAIDDIGRAVDLDDRYVLTCDDKECRAYVIELAGGARAIRLPGALPAGTRAVAGRGTPALFAGEGGVRRWDGVTWSVDIGGGSFNAIDGTGSAYVVVGNNGLIVLRDGTGPHMIPSGTTASLRSVVMSGENIFVLTESGELLFGTEDGLAPCPLAGLKLASMHVPAFHRDKMVGATTDGRVFAVGSDATICVEADPAPDTRGAVAWSCGISIENRLTLTSTKVLGRPRCVFD